MKELNFTFTLDETNLILQALGTMPFQQVYSIIHKIHTQAQEQLSADEQAQLKKPTGS